MYSVYKMPERLDTVVANDIDAEVMPLLAKSPYVIFDFTGCQYMSSSGLRILLKSKKTLTVKKGDLLLVGMDASLLNVMEISGMKSLFLIFPSLEKAEKELDRLCAQESESVEFTYRSHSYSYHAIEGGCQCCTTWDKLDLAGYNELGFSVGTGCPAEDLEYSEDSFQTFFTTGTCAGFLDPSDERPIDFRIAAFPRKTGIYLNKAYSFGQVPSGILKCTDDEALSLAQIQAAVGAFCEVQCTDLLDTSLAVVWSTHITEPSVTVFLRNKDGHFTGGTLFLSEWRNVLDDNALADILAVNLTIDNILELRSLNSEMMLHNPVCALFTSKKSQSSSKTRTVIEVSDKEAQEGRRLDLYKEFLARRIYTDSAKIILKPLQGGFSAQTFQVESFDADDRRLRPTVLKMAAKDMIDRESARCQKYALPYIMNNSAQVIGTEFFAGMGALRYNFVGIGGQGAHLGWLTKLYQTKPIEQLEPLFDKIFTQILYPWYGQAVEKPLKLYTDHDPTLSFFPQLCTTALQVLQIDSQQQNVYAKELGRDVLNPYWFLQQVYPKNRDKTFLYYTGVCHGDLNMQNILIDQLNNVFLIDFSETKFRSVISDFARLEIIFLVDNAPVDTPEDYAAYTAFLTEFYTQTHTLDSTQMPQAEYKGTQTEWVAKNVALTKRMRSYAKNSVHGNEDPVPYYFALMEWVLPIVCYGSVDESKKRLSFLVAALLAEKLYKG